MKPVIEKLSKGSHEAKGTDNQACIMELVSVLANEPWSDRPKCVAPAISSFCIWINDNGAQLHRDKLMLLAPQIVNTRKPKKDPARAKIFAEYALWCAEWAARSVKSAVKSAEYAAGYAAGYAAKSAESKTMIYDKAIETLERVLAV